MRTLISAVKPKLNTLLLFVTFSLGVFACGHAIWIQAKAELAQILIAKAWQQTLETGENTLPWAWADTWPVAKLKFDHDSQALYVLAGSHGSSLAFGPGHIDGTALPGESGTQIISGHRDTHFARLEQLQIGQQLHIQDTRGNWQHYELSRKTLVNIEDGPWMIDPHKNELHLITCFPFNNPIPGGPMRYIVIAKLLEPTRLPIRLEPEAFNHLSSGGSFNNSPTRSAALRLNERLSIASGDYPPTHHF